MVAISIAGFLAAMRFEKTGKTVWGCIAAIPSIVLCFFAYGLGSAFGFWVGSWVIAATLMILFFNEKTVWVWIAAISSIVLCYHPYSGYFGDGEVPGAIAAISMILLLIASVFSAKRG